MGLSTNQQFFELVKKSKKPLITFKEHYTGDALASALALQNFLAKNNKEADIACHAFELQPNYKFLKQTEKIKNQLDYLKKFVISLDLSENKIKDFTYSLEDKKLHIYLTPEKENLHEKHIKFNPGHYHYDLIITLDTDLLESLGHIYEKNTDFFYNTPIINIDHSPDNENYGQVNIIELTKTSVAEIIYDLIEEHNQEFLDQEIATTLLTGLISKTKSFRSANVTPRALNIASQLITSGAQRDLIIEHLDKKWRDIQNEIDKLKKRSELLKEQITKREKQLMEEENEA